MRTLIDVTPKPSEGITVLIAKVYQCSEHGLIGEDVFKMSVNKKTVTVCALCAVELAEQNAVVASLVQNCV